MFLLEGFHGAQSNSADNFVPRTSIAQEDLNACPSFAKIFLNSQASLKMRLSFSLNSEIGILYYFGI